MHCVSASQFRAVWRSLVVLYCFAYLGCAKPPDMTQSTEQAADETTSTSLADNTVAADAVTKPPVANQRQTGRPDTSIRPKIDSDLLKVYNRVNTYSDTTKLQLTYRFADGRNESETTIVKSKFAKPNRLQLEVSSADNRVTVFSDGKTMRARIYDPVTRDFEGQTVVVDAPEKLTVSDLYKITELLDPLSPQEMLSALLGTPTGLDMTPLGILLNEGGLVDLLGKHEQTPVSYQGEARQTAGRGIPREVYAVRQATTPDGTYQFWIDKNSGMLRRITFPSSTTNLPPGIRQIDLVADIESVSTSLQESDFVTTADPQLQEVSHFVMPPLPPPTDQIGKQLGRLQFADADNEPVLVTNNDEQISVVTWFHNHPASQMVIGQLESLRHRVEDDRVRFFHALVEQGTASTSAASTVAEWSLAKPPIFDTQAIGLEKLAIEQAPTTVVLGANNTLHYFGVGANPNVGNEVAVVIERLLAGQNVAEDVLQRNAEAQKAYRRHLASARAGGDGWVEDLGTELPKRTQPRQLRMSEAWSCNDLAEPGNMLIVPGKEKLLLIVDGWNHLAVVSTSGELKKRFPLELPSDAGITLLRAGKDKRDRGLIAATTRGGRRAFVFDFGGKMLMQYPQYVDGRAVIGDVGFGDLDADKDPELITAWQGSQGIHGVGLDGTQRWTNRVASGIVSLGLVPNKRGANSVFVTGEQGRPYLIGGDGRTEREISMGPATIHQLVGWPGSARGYDAIVNDDELPKGLARYLGISAAGGGAVTGIGITEAWQPIWKYPLPSGLYRHQIDWPQSMDLPNIGPTWLIPGADGSVHFVGADGKFTDSFYTGEHLRGIAGLRLDDRLLLILATDGKLTAHEIEVPSK